MAIFDNKYLVVGDGGLVFMYNTLTGAISAKTSGTTEDLWCIDGSDDGMEIFVGGTDGCILHSTDGGERWSVSSLDPTLNRVQRIHYVSSTCVFATGYWSRLYRYNGSSWSRINTGTDSVFGMDANSETDLYYGQNGMTTGNLYRYNGFSVTRDTSFSPHGHIYHVLCVDTNTNYILESDTSYARVYKGKFGSWSLEIDGNTYSPKRLAPSAPWINRESGEIFFLWRDASSSTSYYLMYHHPVHGWSETAIQDVPGSPYHVHSHEDQICAENLNSLFVVDSAVGFEYFNGTTWDYSRSYEVNSAWRPSVAAVSTLEETEILPGESYSPALVMGDLSLDAKGRLMRDYSAESRVYFRLMCRRGQCWYDPDLGSRLYTIKTLKDAQQKARAYVDEALKPLVADGTIISASIGEYYEDPNNGMIAAEIDILVPTSNMPIALGLIPLGGM